MHLSHIFCLSLAATLLVGCQTHSDELASKHDRTAVYVEGVPGGTLLETETLLASVSAIDTGKRTFTLRDTLGSQRTLVAPVQMQNFAQLKVGDQVKAVFSQERIVYLRQPDEPFNDGAAGVLTTAPQGTKPGILAADSVEITAWVKAMDTTLRTATLQLPDGSERTFKVRPDVNMKTEYLGRQVVIRVTTAVAISVQPQ
ncbi:hypothetical protein HBN76_08755 [Pseudomonas sp. WS 5013]|uniref:hypothetical protein n=1 Tax=Pseudomonas sp. WS 5013 TaxID=2717475 RepID=UPI001472B22E|nr:hypothetical protein [Pseudomonas sp. WS 5013]NMY41394.1 hypothetical protein [Pseudomonas sp. WS 5013]